MSCSFLNISIFILFLPFCITIYNSYAIGCKGTNSWLFWAWNINSSCATHVRDWVFIFGERSNSVNQFKRWIFTSKLIFYISCDWWILINNLWLSLENNSLFFQHFLHSEPIVGIEYEAQLQKTLLPRELIRHVLVSSGIKFINIYSDSLYSWVDTSFL